MKVTRVLGGRVVKTGVAVFLTATACLALGWSPVFAVITAIVTLEPTVSDSIKKGIVRFPASVIGSGYAVILIALFGNSAITYTLAAVLTIVTCFKLNLHAGLLVATLTAVTMVEVIDSNYLLAFLTRLGTTSIGLLVSTGVNMFVLPPDYTEDIFENVHSIRKKTGTNVKETFAHILDPQIDSREAVDEKINKVRDQIRKTELLIRFQNDEAKYHPLIGKEKRQFLKAEDQLTQLRMLHYHLDNLNQMTIDKTSWSVIEREAILDTVEEVGDCLQKKSCFDGGKHKHRIERLIEIFWKNNEKILRNDDIEPTTFPSELIILYELVAIYNLVTQFYKEGNPAVIKENPLPS